MVGAHTLSLLASFFKVLIKQRQGQPKFLKHLRTAKPQYRTRYQEKKDWPLFCYFATPLDIEGDYVL
jgi:hypothetical protein